MSGLADLWRFLDPKDSAQRLRDFVLRRVFPDNNSDDGPLFALVKSSFADCEEGAGRPEQVYRDFFTTLGSWQRIVATGKQAQTRKAQADRHIWNVVRRSRVACLPVILSGGGTEDRLVEQAVRLPEVDENTSKKRWGGNTVFLRKATADDDADDGGPLTQIGRAHV